MSFDLESCEHTGSSDYSVEDRLPSKNCLIRGKESVYAVGTKISQGKYGAVYEVLRRSDGKRFACKLEVSNSHSYGLDQDFSVMQKVAKRGVDNLVKMVDRGKIEEHFKFIIMPLLGRNLLRMQYMFEEERFSLSTALRVALLAIPPIQALHQMGYVHRDIKKTNFCLHPNFDSKRPETIHLILIDFGICRSFKDRNGDLKVARTNVGFRGTTRFASLAAHHGEDQSPKDDMESWFYMMIEMITGSLPWSYLHRDQQDEVAAMKDQCRQPEAAAVMMKYCPKVEFRRIQTYLMGLKYQNTVDYTFISEIVHLAMKNNGLKMDEKYDWEDDST